jgi:hypothetical protein
MLPRSTGPRLERCNPTPSDRMKRDHGWTSATTIYDAAVAAIT